MGSDNSRDSKDIMGAVFVRHDGGGYFASAAAFYGQSAVDFAGSDPDGIPLAADYDVKFAGLSVKAGKQFAFDTWRVTPRLGLTYTGVSMPAFGEKGDGLTKKYESSKSQSLEAEFGVLFAKEIDLGGGRYVVPHLNLGLAYETLDTTTSLTTSFADQPDIPSFTS
jgi:outer membrane autotransporter protein